MRPERESHAGHRQVTGLLIPGIVLVVVALLVSTGWVLGSSVAVAAGLYWVLVIVLMLGAARSASPPASLPADDDQEEPAQSRWSSVLHRVPRISVRWGRPLAALLVLGLAAVVYFLPVPEPVASTSGSFGLAGLLVAIAFGGSVLARYYDATPVGELADAPGLATAARVGTWLSLLACASSVLRAVGQPMWERQVVLALIAVPVVLATELFLMGLWGLFQREPQTNPAFGADLQTSRFLGSSFNPLQSIFVAVERTFGVDVRGSWALSFLRRAVAPVVLGLGLTAWLLSAAVIVDPSQQGVRERFGRVQAGEVLGPGLHIGLPWPFDRVRLVDVRRVREVPIGYVEAKVGANALWTKSHAAEEFNLLLGDGRDLVTVNAELQYRVGNVHEWLYSTQNPDTGLETLAYQLLMSVTVNQTLAEVLSTDIGDFSARMATSIQALADENQLGVEVISFNLRGLHPPVAVAPDYQAVVAAQVAGGTYAMEAEAYRYEAVPAAQAEAALTTRGAAAERADRLSKARGEAIAFKTLGAEYLSAPKLYRFRLRLETIEELLADSQYYVIDARIERDGGALWFIN